MIRPVIICVRLLRWLLRQRNPRAYRTTVQVLASNLRLNRQERCSDRRGSVRGWQSDGGCCVTVNYPTGAEPVRISDLFDFMNQLYKEESLGTYGSFEIEINVGATKLPDLKQEAIRCAVYDAVKLLKSAVMAAVVNDNPDAQKRKENQRRDLLAFFQEPIHVEEIPNGYCSDWCCRHLPWFVVTTKIGHFTIGWRKRVIHIDWKATVGTKTAAELFPSENVTKDDCSIHAWSFEDARRYIETIMASASKSND